MLIKLNNVGDVTEARRFLDKLEDLGDEMTFLNLIPEDGEGTVKEVKEDLDEYIDKSRKRLDLIEGSKTYPVYLDIN